MVQPPEPKRKTAQEIQERHDKINEASKLMGEELLDLQKKLNVKQEPLLKNSARGNYAYIAVYPFNWETGKIIEVVDEEKYKAYYVAKDVIMRKHGLKQQAYVESSVRGMYPYLNTFPFDWEKENADEDEKLGDTQVMVPEVSKPKKIKKKKT